MSKPLCILGASNGLEFVWNTRQAKHESTTTGQAELAGIEPSLYVKDIQSLYSDFNTRRHFTGTKTLCFILMTRVLLLLLLLLLVIVTVIGPSGVQFREQSSE